MKLVASMLVKNELGRYLQASIGSLRDFCDLIVVLDDGSTDRTSEWLEDNADEKMIVNSTGEREGFFDGHEGARRQALLDFTLERAAAGDYVLAVDADEFVANGAAVRAFCEVSGAALGTLMMEEVWTTETQLGIRCDGGWRPHPVPILWRVPDEINDTWRIQDRALACGREPMAVRDLFRQAKPTGTEILHFGWANEAERAGRYERYVEADGGKFHNRHHLDSIMWADRRVKLKTRRWPKGLGMKDGRVEYHST